MGCTCNGVVEAVAEFEAAARANPNSVLLRELRKERLVHSAGAMRRPAGYRRR